MTTDDMTERATLRVRIDNDHRYHKPPPADADRMESIRRYARDLAMAIIDVCPISRELSTALTRIEEAVFHANAAIARHGGNPDDV